MMEMETPAQSPTQPLTLRDTPLDPTLAALSTLSLLNLRLSRLEFLITGASQNEPIPLPEGQTIPSQLRTIESRLKNLKRLDGLPGSLVRMVDTLRREYPELFPSTSTSATTTPATDPRLITTLATQSAEVLAHSSLYTSTSSRLQTLQTLHIPPAEHSANLINAAPRLEQLRKRQAELDAEIEELTRRSASILEWWVRDGVVGMGELWEDWEDRVRVCERAVRREERRLREERGEGG